MARPVRKSRVKKVSLSEVKDDLSRYLREAEDREVVITRHGKPAGAFRSDLGVAVAVTPESGDCYCCCK